MVCILGWAHVKEIYRTRLALCSPSYPGRVGQDAPGADFIALSGLGSTHHAAAGTELHCGTPAAPFGPSQQNTHDHIMHQSGCSSPFSHPLLSQKIPVYTWEVFLPRADCLCTRNNFACVDLLCSSKIKETSIKHTLAERVCDLYNIYTTDNLPLSFRIKKKFKKRQNFAPLFV